MRHRGRMAMTQEQIDAEKARKLRLLESAAGSAILNGATPEEARQRVDAGIAEALHILATQNAASAVAGH